MKIKYQLGRGIGLMFVIMGIFSIFVTFIAYLYARLRLLEDELPDTIPFLDQLDFSQDIDECLSQKVTSFKKHEPKPL